MLMIALIISNYFSTHTHNVNDFKVRASHT